MFQPANRSASGYTVTPSTVITISDGTVRSDVAWIHKPVLQGIDLSVNVYFPYTGRPENRVYRLSASKSKVIYRL